MPTLLFLNSPLVGRDVPILRDRFVIGRALECDLELSSRSPYNTSLAGDGISRNHAILTRVEGGWFIEDGDGKGRASRNGTFLNNQRVSQAPVGLNDGDVILICSSMLAFHTDPPLKVYVPFDAMPLVAPIAYSQRQYT